MPLRVPVRASTHPTNTAIPSDPCSGGSDDFPVSAFLANHLCRKIVGVAFGNKRIRYHPAALSGPAPKTFPRSASESVFTIFGIFGLRELPDAGRTISHLPLHLPVEEVEGQPLGANVKRVIAAFEFLGAPLPSATVEKLNAAITEPITFRWLL